MQWPGSTTRQPLNLAKMTAATTSLAEHMGAAVC
jgi:hypothetical protein